MNEFPGLTRTDCAQACNAERCVISGKSYCAHPCKCGAPYGADARNPEISARYAAARSALGLDQPTKTEGESKYDFHVPI